MSLYKRKESRFWITEIQVNGQRYRKSTGKQTKREAREVELQWHTELLVEVRQTYPSITLEEAARRYWLEGLKPREQKRRTVQKVQSNLRYILSYFGRDKKLDSLATGDIASWRLHLLSQGLAAGTVNRRLADLRAIMRRAMKWGVAVEVPEFDMVKGSSPKDRYLADDEYQRLLEMCPPHLHSLAVFLAGTGARLGEATALTWGQVALPVNGDRGRVMFTQTKSGKSRGVPLPQEVTEMLWRVKPPAPVPDDRVFLYDGQPYDDPKKSWQRARRLAGLPWLRIHDLRHYYAARLVRKGVSLYSVQRLLGHSTPALTQRYAAIRPEDLEGQVAVLD
jgi:integrase